MNISDTTQLEETGTEKQEHRANERIQPRTEGNVIIMMLVFIAVSLIGARIIFTTGIMDRLFCERNATTDVTCTVEFTWWGVISLEQFSVHQPEKISVDDYCGDQARPCDYYVRIDGGTQDTISLLARSEDQANEFADSIRAFISPASQEETLDIGVRVHINDVLGLIFGLFLVVFFGFIMYLLLFQKRIRQRAVMFSHEYTQSRE